MFNRHRTVTISTVQGSSSTSTIKETYTSSNTTFHSYSSLTSTNPTLLERNSSHSNVKQPINTVPYQSGGRSVTPTSSETKLSSTNNVEQFQLDCLNAHNEYRRKHNVGPLKLNPTLSNFAQNWANTIARKRQLQHSSAGKYGENIYWSSGKGIHGKTPVDSWYNEIKQYNYKNASYSPGTGHFTQVVWKNSSDLGVGMTCVGDEVYVVASYDPPGNYSGEFSKNVFPPK